jgi:hypothetical protein
VLEILDGVRGFPHRPNYQVHRPNLFVFSEKLKILTFRDALAVDLASH